MIIINLITLFVCARCLHWFPCLMNSDNVPLGAGCIISYHCCNCCNDWLDKMRVHWHKLCRESNFHAFALLKAFIVESTSAGIICWPSRSLARSRVFAIEETKLIFREKLIKFMKRQRMCEINTINKARVERNPAWWFSLVMEIYDDQNNKTIKIQIINFIFIN